jgi:hypothetical protein
METVVEAAFGNKPLEQPDILRFFLPFGQLLLQENHALAF